VHGCIFEKGEGVFRKILAIFMVLMFLVGDVSKGFPLERNTLSPVSGYAVKGGYTGFQTEMTRDYMEMTHKAGKPFLRKEITDGCFVEYTQDDYDCLRLNITARRHNASKSRKKKAGGDTKEAGVKKEYKIPGMFVLKDWRKKRSVVLRDYENEVPIMSPERNEAIVINIEDVPSETVLNCGISSINNVLIFYGKYKGRKTALIADCGFPDYGPEELIGWAKEKGFTIERVDLYVTYSGREISEKIKENFPECVVKTAEDKENGNIAISPLGIIVTDYETHDVMVRRWEDAEPLAIKKESEPSDKNTIFSGLVKDSVKDLILEYAQQKGELNLNEAMLTRIYEDIARSEDFKIISKLFFESSKEDVVRKIFGLEAGAEVRMSDEEYYRLWGSAMTLFIAPQVIRNIYPEIRTDTKRIDLLRSYYYGFSALSRKSVRTDLNMHKTLLYMLEHMCGQKVFNEDVREFLEKGIGCFNFRFLENDMELYLQRHIYRYSRFPFWVIKDRDFLQNGLSTSLENIDIYAAAIYLLSNDRSRRRFDNGTFGEMKDVFEKYGSEVFTKILDKVKKGDDSIFHCIGKLRDIVKTENDLDPEISGSIANCLLRMGESVAGEERAVLYEKMIPSNIELMRQYGMDVFTRLCVAAGSGVNGLLSEGLKLFKDKIKGAPDLDPNVKDSVGGYLARMAKAAGAEGSKKLFGSDLAAHVERYGFKPMTEMTEAFGEEMQFLIGYINPMYSQIKDFRCPDVREEGTLVYYLKRLHERAGENRKCIFECGLPAIILLLNSASDLDPDKKGSIGYYLLRICDSLGENSVFMFQWFIPVAKGWIETAEDLDPDKEDSVMNCLIKMFNRLCSEKSEEWVRNNMLRRFSEALKKVQENLGQYGMLLFTKIIEMYGKDGIDMLNMAVSLSKLVENADDLDLSKPDSLISYIAAFYFAMQTSGDGHSYAYSTVNQCFKFISEKKDLDPKARGSVAYYLAGAYRKVGENFSLVIYQGFERIRRFVSDKRELNAKRKNSAMNLLVRIAGLKFQTASKLIDDYLKCIHSKDELVKFVGHLEYWKDYEMILGNMLNVVSSREAFGEDKERLQVELRCLIVEILESETSGFAVIFAEGCSNQLFQTDKYDTLRKLVFNQGVDLKTRMKVLCDYNELMMYDNLLQDDWSRTELKRNVNQAHIEAKADCDSVISEIETAKEGEDVSIRGLQEKISRRVGHLRKDILFYVIGRQLKPEEEELINNDDIRKKILRIAALSCSLNKGEPQLIRQVFIGAIEAMLGGYDPKNPNKAEAIENALSALNRWIMSIDREMLAELYLKASPQRSLESYKEDLKERKCNKEIVDELVEHGYNRKLWEDGVELTMDLTKGLTEEEKTEQILSATYEVVEKAIELGMKKIHGRKLTLNYAKNLDTFAETKHFIDEMKKGITLTPNDERRLKYILDSVRDMESQKICEDAKPQKFRVTIRKDFIKEATSGVGVPGCYAPDGLYKEIPLIHALESNVMFMQVFRGETQVANAVIVMTDKGAFVFAGYNSSEYNMDTIFAEALRELRKLVPKVYLLSNSAGYNTLKNEVREEPEAIELSKPYTVSKHQYFDAIGFTSEGNLTIKEKFYVLEGVKGRGRDDGRLEALKESVNGYELVLERIQKIQEVVERHEGEGMPDIDDSLLKSIKDVFEIPYGGSLKEIFVPGGKIYYLDVFLAGKDKEKIKKRIYFFKKTTDLDVPHMRFIGINDPEHIEYARTHGFWIRRVYIPEFNDDEQRACDAIGRLNLLMSVDHFEQSLGWLGASEINKSVLFKLLLSALEDESHSERARNDASYDLGTLLLMNRGFAETGLTISQDEFKRLLNIRRFYGYSFGNLGRSIAEILKNPKINIEGDPDKMKAQGMVKNEMFLYFDKTLPAARMEKNTYAETMFWSAFLTRMNRDEYYDIVMKCFEEYESGSHQFKIVFNHVFEEIGWQNGNKRKYFASAVWNKAKFKIDAGGISTRESSFNAIFNNEHNRREFLRGATMLRMMYGFKLSTSDPRPPLQYALENGIYFKIAEGLYMTPVSETFRRHIIFATDGSEPRPDGGNIRYKYEVIIPGREETKKIVYIEERMDFIDKIKTEFPDKDYCVGYFAKGAFNGVYDIYDMSVEYPIGVRGGENCLQVLAYEYDEDGKRLDNINDSILHDLADQYGWQDMQAIKMSITHQLAELTAVVHALGYRGFDEENQTDLHIGNFRFYADQNGIRIKFVGDFESFRKPEAGLSEDDIRIDCEMLICRWMNYHALDEKEMLDIFERKLQEMRLLLEQRKLSRDRSLAEAV